MVYEGLRVRGIWEILRKPVRKRARKVLLKGNAKKKGDKKNEERRYGLRSPIELIRA